LLFQELGHFPLAIVQAGAYIRTHECSIQGYIDMYHESQGQLLEEYAGLVPKLDDYPYTAYATWRVSFENLDLLPKQLFELLAFMHHDHISEQIFRSATIEIPHYVPASASQTGDGERTTS
jgi:hypothetical protein